jgi:hypothetical protein
MTTDQAELWAARDVEYMDAYGFACTWCGAAAWEPCRMRTRATWRAPVHAPRVDRMLAGRWGHGPGLDYGHDWRRVEWCPRPGPLIP